MQRIPVLHSEDDCSKTSYAANLARRYANGSLVTAMTEHARLNKLGLSMRPKEKHEAYGVLAYSLPPERLTMSWYRHTLPA